MLCYIGGNNNYKAHKCNEYSLSFRGTTITRLNYLEGIYMHTNITISSCIDTARARQREEV